jgi:outer membrane protein assembly factor BamB
MGSLPAGAQGGTRMTEQTPAAFSPWDGSRYPGWIARPVMAVTLVGAVLVRMVGRLDDPPFPLDDPAIRNLLTLICCFTAGLTLWIWFCFRSTYPRRARMGVVAGTAIGLVALVGVIAALGFTRVIHFSGSMVPRLAGGEHDFGSFASESPVSQVDLASTTPDDFPQFLGPERSGWINGPALSRDWQTTPPRQLWKRPCGAGWSGFAAVNGFAVTLEQRGGEEWAVCYEIESGKPAWGQAIGGRHENPLGGIGPRSTPTIFEGRVYVLGATGLLQCLGGASGKMLWSDDLRKRYGVADVENGQVVDEQFVMWGRAASPLIVDRLVVVPGGGPQGKAKNLVAFDLETGKLVWEAENKLPSGEADQIAYASPALATLAGRRQILIVNESTASGHDPENGQRLWSHPWPGHSNGNASASQAVAVGTNRVLLSKGYSGGAEVIELSPGSRDELTVSTVWKSPRVLQTKFTNVVIRAGHAFALSEGILECVELDSGRRRWKSGRYGHGQILGVGDLLLALSEEGELHLVELNAEKFVQHGSIQAIRGKTWNNLCLYGKRLLVRNAEEAACFELP